MNLAEKILELRKANGMSKEQLAEKMNVSPAVYIKVGVRGST